MPHSLTWPASGDQIPTHPEPPEGGYYTNWDPYAVDLELLPTSDVNPVKTQHVLVATVRDKDGKPLPNRRVEWMIAEGSVGDIVEVDESGWRASRGYKMDNKFAVTHTNNWDHVLDRGNDDPSDDIHLEPGQTWCVITSPIEGTTHIVAYAPGIYDWSKHKVFAVKHWFDVGFKLPPDAVNRVGTDHVLTTRVMKPSDGSPLAGYKVTYTVISGPAATFAEGGKATASVTTNASGTAKVTLQQVEEVEGVNEVEIIVGAPAGVKTDEALHIGSGVVRKTWLAPQIAITKDAPATAMIGETFQYDIVVRNPGSTSANNVVVTDPLPGGIEYVSSSPPASRSGQQLSWRLGAMEAGAGVPLSVTVKGTRQGVFVNPVSVKADDGLSDEDDAQTKIIAAKLTLEKDGPSEAVFCNAFSYTLIVRNTGDGPATNVQLRDDLPADIPTTTGKQSVVADLGTIQPGESKKVTFTVKPTRAGTFTNKAVVTADNDLSADATLKTVVRQPVLSLTKTGPAEKFLGQKIVYELTLTNKGDAPAEKTVLVDMVPAGTSFVSASDGGRRSGGKVVWDFGTLPVNATKKVTLTLKAASIGTADNAASATATCAEATAEASTKIVGIPAVLLECVDTADPIEVGKNEVYKITVTNQGTAEGTNIVVECVLPAELTFISTDGPTDGTFANGKVTFAPLKSLASKQKAVFEVKAKAAKPGDVRFAVQLTSDQIDTPVNETESTRLYE
jgi:uncharacterized repeat protein (TIGR01451 family)